MENEKEANGTLSDMRAWVDTQQTGSVQVFELAVEDFRLRTFTKAAAFLGHPECVAHIIPTGGHSKAKSTMQRKEVWDCNTRKGNVKVTSDVLPNINQGQCGYRCDLNAKQWVFILAVGRSGSTFPV
jgi:hypothetical protein